MPLSEHTVLHQLAAAPSPCQRFDILRSHAGAMTKGVALRLHALLLSEGHTGDYVVDILGDLQSGEPCADSIDKRSLRYWRDRNHLAYLPSEGDGGAAVRKALGDLRGKYALDVGSCTGTTARFLRNQGAKVVGVESSMHSLGGALREGDNTDIQYVNAYFQCMPFAAATFDVAFLRYVGGLDALSYEEIFRLLKPQAHFVMHEPIRSMAYPWVPLTKDVLEKGLTSAGFINIDLRDSPMEDGRSGALARAERPQ